MGNERRLEQGCRVDEANRSEDDNDQGSDFAGGRRHGMGKDTEGIELDV